MLVGGSALALRIRHRISEDLDLAFPDSVLPRARIDAMLRLAQEAGLDFQHNDDEAAVQEFALGGLELRDYQQNFLVDRVVKVSFFTPDTEFAQVFTELSEPTPRVASLAELFKTKCLVSARRSKTRDWLDLYILMYEHGFSIRDYKAAFLQAGSETQFDIGLARLCSGVPQRDDEGYSHLMSDPPTIEVMKAFFIAERDRLEVESAARAFRNKDATP